MAQLLFSLRNVPDEEADGVRQLLDQNGIAYYETSAGNWGIATPAIWLNNDDDLPRARQLLDGFQRDYVTRQQHDYAQSVSDGSHKTFWQGLQQQPLKVVLYIVLILAVLYFSIKPFLSLSH